MDDSALTRLVAATPTPGEAPFAVHADDRSPFVGALCQTLLAKGHPEHPVPGAGTRLVLSMVDPERPRAFRRRFHATFVVAVVELDERPPDVLAAGYPYLVRALANLCLLVVPERGRRVTYVVTLERGCYPVGVDRHGDVDADALYEHLAPLALSRLVIDNVFVPDLPAELEDGDGLTEELATCGRRLDALGLLPAPFPLEQLLSERDRRHVMRLFGVGGLSYGNLSARRDGQSFWMSASGVDKSALATVGQDVVLISGFDEAQLALRVSVPPRLARPRRASVDAIEHWMIYRRHPEVGAIVHVHAWMEGVPATTINYPCGTVELASAVADLIAGQPEPANAVVGQKNHGLTITGRNLAEILDRIEGRLSTSVPMAA